MSAMKKLFVIAAFVLAAAVSCTKEFATDEVISVEVTPEGYVPVTLRASIDGATKANLEGSSIKWEVGEEIAVFANGAGEP